MITDSNGDSRDNALMPKSTKELKVMREFSDRFTALTRKHDPTLSNKSLGKQFGVSETAVFKWKNAKSVPAMANACLIALRYKVSVEWLLTGREQPTGLPETHKELATLLSGLSPESFERVCEAARAYQALEKERS